jgi:hypothetical protein
MSYIMARTSYIKGNDDDVLFVLEQLIILIPSSKNQFYGLWFYPNGLEPIIYRTKANTLTIIPPMQLCNRQYIKMCKIDIFREHWGVLSFLYNMQIVHQKN